MIITERVRSDVGDLEVVVGSRSTSQKIIPDDIISKNRDLYTNYRPASTDWPPDSSQTSLHRHRPAFNWLSITLNQPSTLSQSHLPITCYLTAVYSFIITPQISLNGWLVAFLSSCFFIWDFFEAVILKLYYMIYSISINGGMIIWSIFMMNRKKRII